MMEQAEIYLIKAYESVAGAESEFANGRYDNCANRSYYACFQAAIAALLHAGVIPQRQQRTWGHSFVQAEFIRRLINRQKVYPAHLRTVMSNNLNLRHTADYEPDRVTQREARRALQRSREFIAAINQEVSTHDN